jgi:NAD(P)-dependent dehydrogenase (short-subunit alcohol dehydrogenase family)
MSLEAYRAHQRTMRAFLDSQRQVFARLMALEKEVDSVVAGSPVQSWPAAAALGVVESSQTKKPGALGRYSVSRRPLPVTRDRSEICGCFLVASESADFATSIADSLREHGAQAACLSPASLRSAEALKNSVDEVRLRLGPVAGIVFAQGIGDQQMPEDLEAWRNGNLLGVKALFSLLQICAQDLRRANGWVLSFSAMGGDFGRGHAAWQSLPSSGAAVGLIKTAAIEWPEVTFKAVDLESSEPHLLARIVTSELLSGDKAAEIGYSGGVRNVFEEAPAPFPVEIRPQTLWQVEPDWVLFATGGARGITAEVVSEMLLPGMSIHLVGRAPEPNAEPAWSRDAPTAGELRKKIINLAKANGRTLTPALVEKEIAAVLRDREIRANIEGFRKKGARVVYHSADVCDEAEMQSILNSIYDEHGRLDAVIHGAGIIEDKLLVDKTAESFRRVFDTKADSTWLLSRHLKPDSLKCLAFFGSVAGRTGNPGQCDYAAANELVNRFAWWLHRRWPHVKISAINWGPWESGMASAEINRRFRERGVIPIPPAEGRAFFKREVVFGPSSDVEIVAGYFEPPDQKQTLTVAWPLLQGIAVDRAGDDALWEGSLSLKNYPFLDDHRIDDKIVVPWAVAVELMAETVQAAWPQWHVTEARNHRQMRGITVEDDRALPLRVTARLKESGESLVVKAMILAPDPPPRPFYQAAFVLRKEPLDLARQPSFPATAPASIPTQTFYAEHAFHGPSFRLIDLITGLDESGVDAAISPRGRGWNWLEVPWIFQPGVLDTAMQVGSFWTQLTLNGFALPTRAERIVRYGAYLMSGEQSRVLVRIRSATKQTIHFDFFVLNSQSMVLLCAHGVEMAHSKALLRLASQGLPV